MIDILVIAVVGGLKRPIGPFIGALIYVLLSIFSSDMLTAFGLSGERFKLVIGLGFLAIVFFSPDGVLGLWEQLAGATRTATAIPLTGGASHGDAPPIAAAPPTGSARSAPATRWSCAA